MTSGELVELPNICNVSGLCRQASDQAALFSGAVTSACDHELAHPIGPFPPSRTRIDPHHC